MASTSARYAFQFSATKSGQNRMISAYKEIKISHQAFVLIMASYILCLLQNICCGWSILFPTRARQSPVDLSAATAQDLQELLEARKVTSVELVDQYFRRIEQHDDTLHAVLERSPRAREDADACDRKRRRGFRCGPLFGIPILIKVFSETAIFPSHINMDRTTSKQARSWV